MKALELAKVAQTGVEFTYFDVIELLGHLKSFEETCGILAEYEKFEAQIKALEKHILKTDLINFEKMMDMNNRITALEQTLASLRKEMIE